MSVGEIESPSDSGSSSEPKLKSTRDTEASDENKNPTGSPIELFHTPDKRPWATVQVGGHCENSCIENAEFRRWLTGHQFKLLRKPPKKANLDRRIETFAAQAVHDGPELPVYLRIAEHADAVWCDLGDDDWRAVRVDLNGWRVETTAPVKVRRPHSMRPITEPCSGGTIADLRQFVNVADDEDFILLIAWILGAFNPTGPNPIMVLQGVQGAAKSTTARVLRLLIDPNQANLRTTPNNERDLFITAENSWVVTVDNLSGLHPRTSDALCQISTGSGFATRKLYTDADEIIFYVQRPIILNGIEMGQMGSDLLDRSIVLELPPIEPKKSTPENVFWDRFRVLSPKILGVILDAVASCLRHRASCTVTEPGRMADFVMWVSAGISELGIKAETFQRAYLRNRQQADVQAVESHPAVIAIMDYLGGNNGQWTGTATELLAAISFNLPFAEAKSPSWPTDARALSATLKRLSPNLATIGVDVKFDRSAANKLIHLTLRKAPVTQ